MAMDSLMYEEDVDMPACCEGKMCDGDAEPFASLLHFADHCLYRIVRWARNLPDFSSVSVSELDLDLIPLMLDLDLATRVAVIFCL